MSNNISFKKVENTDLVFLNDNLLCTIDYDSDFEVETTRKNIREILKNHYKEEQSHEPFKRCYKPYN